MKWTQKLGVVLESTTEGFDIGLKEKGYSVLLFIDEGSGAAERTYVSKYDTCLLLHENTPRSRRIRGAANFSSGPVFGDCKSTI